MKVRYLKSATVGIESNGVKILTDPWLVDGEYYGSWFHYPKFVFNEDYFSDIDYIYLSHIHPDHFSIKTFKQLNKKIPVLIHTYEHKFLKFNLENLGFSVLELPHNTRTHLKNDIHINILAADNCNPAHCAKFLGCALIETKFGSTQIDSLCVIDNGEQFVLNTNDCPFELAKPALEKVKNLYPKIDLMLVGYGGAGPFPQCFIMPEDAKIKAAEAKRIQFLNQALDFINLMKPSYVLPFAGTYVLGGRLSNLQKYRGVPEIEEAADYLGAHNSQDTQVLLLNTYEYFDIKESKASKPYEETDLKAKKDYIQNILSKEVYDFELDPLPSIDELLPLIKDAYTRLERTRLNISVKSNTTILVKLAIDTWCSLSVNGAGYAIISEEQKAEIVNFVSYEVDPRLLVKILKGPRFAHWNNAEIGSHILLERSPEIYERELYYLMCYFHA